jgi:hypothetical protein
MSKQRIENSIRKMEKFRKERLQEIGMPGILYNCIINNKVPKDPKIKTKVWQVEDFYSECLCAQVLPNAPPVSTPEPKNRPNKKKPTLITKQG